MSQINTAAQMGISDLIADYQSTIGQLLDGLSPESFPPPLKNSYQNFQRVLHNVCSGKPNWEFIKEQCRLHLLFQAICQTSLATPDQNKILEDPVFQSWEDFVWSFKPIVHLEQTYEQLLKALQQSFGACPGTAQDSWREMACRSAGLLPPNLAARLSPSVYHIIYQLSEEIVQGYLDKKDEAIHVLDPNAGAFFCPNLSKQVWDKHNYISRISEYYYFLSQGVLLGEKRSVTEASSSYTFSFVNPLGKLTYGALSQQIHLFDSQNLLIQQLLRQIEMDYDLLVCDLREVSHPLVSPSPQLEKKIKSTWGKLPPYYRNKQNKPISYLIRWSMDRLAKKGLNIFILDREYLAQASSSFLKHSFLAEYQKIYLWESPPLRLSSLTSRNEQISIVFLLREQAPRSSRRGVQNSPAQVYYHPIGQEKTLKTTDFQEFTTQQFLRNLYPSGFQEEQVLPLFIDPEEDRPAQAKPAIFHTKLQALHSPWKNQILKTEASELQKRIQNILEEYQKAAPGQLPKSVAWPKNFQKIHEQQFPIQFQKDYIQSVWANPYRKSYAYLDPLFLDQSPEILKHYHHIKPKNLSLIWGFSAQGLPKISISSLPVWATPGYPVCFMPFLLLESSSASSPSHNISPQTVQFFQDHYQGQWQEWTFEIKEALNLLFNFSELEQCHISPDFADEIRTMFAWTQKGKNLDHLYRYLPQPQDKTGQVFKEWSQLFRKALRRHEQMGQKISPNSESREILNQYFRDGAQALQSLEGHLEQVAQGLRPQALEYEISAQDVFEYTLAVLQSPNYRDMADLYRYRPAPLLPLLPAFQSWRNWGKALLQLQVNQEELAPWNLKIRHLPKPEPDGKECYRIHPDMQEVTLEFSSQRWVLSNIPERLWDSPSFDMDEVLAVLLPPKTAREASVSENEVHPQSICDHFARLLRVQYETHLIYEEMAGRPI